MSALPAAPLSSSLVEPAQCTITAVGAATMWGKGRDVWNWTSRKTKTAAGTALTTVQDAAPPVVRKCSPAVQAVTSKKKDVAGVAVGTVAVQAAVVPALNLVGFTSIGPAASSWAAYSISLYAGAVPAGRQSRLRSGSTTT